MFKSATSKQIRATSTIKSKPAQHQPDKEEPAPPRDPKTEPASKLISKPAAVPYICTFCHHIVTPTEPDSKPRTIGRSTRLACEACYDAILKLAVCWVCGEVVARGEDCVSLGWCFWHRACYGCLFCGSKRISKGVRIAELYGVEEKNAVEKGFDKGKQKSAMRQSESSGSKRRSIYADQEGIAKEIDEVPLCAACAAETESSNLDSEQIAELSLSRIDKTDGGVSRARWEEQKAKPAEKPQAHQQMQQTQLRRDPPSTASLKERARRFQGDGSEDGEPLYEPTTQSQQNADDDQLFGWSSCPVPLDSNIYVSLSDPLNAPAFKPSPTKPVPLWMTLLSQNWYDVIPWEQRPNSILDAHFPRRAAREPPVSSQEKVFCPTPHVYRYTKRKRHVSWERPVDDRSYVSEGSVILEETDRETIEAIEPPRKGWISPPAVSHVVKEPLIRPSSRQALHEMNEVDSIDQRLLGHDVKTEGPSSAHQRPSNSTPITNAVPFKPDPSILRPAEERRHQPRDQPQPPPEPQEKSLTRTIHPQPHRSDGAHVISAHASQIRRKSRSPNLRNSSTQQGVLLEPSQTHPTTVGTTSTDAHKVPAPMRSSEFLTKYPVVAAGRTVLVPSDLTRQKSSTELRGGSKSIASVGTVSRETAKGKGVARTDAESEDVQKDGACERAEVFGL